MNIAVYCGSSFGAEDKYRQAAERLGAWIGERGHTLVFGGGEAGLMGVVARAAYERGSCVIGVVPGNVDFICSRPQPYCTRVITTASMAERKQKMLELADAFVALPGGIGTLDEITEAITLNRVGVFAKPAVLFDAGGYYAPFRQLLAGMEQAGFIAPGAMDKDVLFTDDTAQIEAFFHA